MKVSNSQLLLIACVLAIPLGIYLFINWYYSEENHTVITAKHSVEFTIVPIEKGLLGPHDQYAFSVGLNNHPENSIVLEIKNCLSRCWVLANSPNSNDLILCGCHDNYGRVYKFDFVKMRAKSIRSNEIPEGFILIDTLTNLYNDHLLGSNFHYK